MSAARSRSIAWSVAHAGRRPDRSCSKVHERKRNPIFAHARGRTRQHDRQVDAGTRAAGLRHRLGARRSDTSSDAPLSRSTYPSFSPLVVGLIGTNDRPGAERAHDRQHRVDAVLEMDGDAIAALERRAPRTAAARGAPRFELGVGQPLARRRPAPRHSGAVARRPA